MAIDFTSAVAALGTGILDGDEKIRKENLKLHSEKLAAKRDAMIAMKTSKYERELKRYEENKPKIDSLNALKVSFGNNEIDAATYGKNYIMATKGAAEVKNIMSTFNTQQERDKYFATIGNSDPIKNDAVWKDFKTEAVIDSNYQKSINDIENKYATMLKKAGGDSPLINLILGKKKEEIASLDIDMEDDKKSINTINEVNKTINTADKNKLDEIQSTISTKDTESDTVINNESIKALESVGYTITNEPKVYGVPEKWKKDSDISQLRKEVKGKISSINKNTVNTTLEVLSTLDIAMPKQFLTYEQGNKNAPVTGFKDAGKIVNKDIKLLDNQALNFMSNEWIYGKDTDASNVSNYYSSIEAENLLTSRIRDYSSELSTSQIKKGFWKDRENFVGFVPFSVVGLDNDFKFKDGDNIKFVTIDESNRKLVGGLYYQTLKKIALKNDPEFKNSTEAEAINAMQDKLLKLKDGQSSALLTEVKNEMKKVLIKSTTDSADSGTSGTSGTGEKRVIYNGNSIIVNDESTKLFKDNGVDINTLPEDNVTNNNKKTTTTTTNTNEANAANEVSTIDESKTETVAKLEREKAIGEEKIRPSGDAGQNEFQNRSEVLAILPRKMSGKEIKERYAIAFPLNNWTIYYPSK